MITIRVAARRPVFRCLNKPSVPLRNPQIRHKTNNARSDIESVLRQPRKLKGPQIEQDSVSLHRADAVRRAQAIRKRNWLALGAALSMIAPIFLVKLWDVPLDNDKKEDESKNDEDKEQSTGQKIAELITGPPTKADAPRKASEEFQGKKVIIAAGDKVIAAPASSENPQASDADAIDLVETGSSYVPYFPRTIRLPTDTTGPENISSDAEYTLLGLGIRKVSFLKIQVYVVGLYVRTADLSALQNHLINTVNPTASALIPGEKEDLRQSLLDGEKSNKIWESILSKDGPGAVDMAIRIVPCRGTDFKHLQDALMRGIASRTDEVRRKQADLLRQQAVESKTIALPKPVEDNEFSDESFGLSMKQFKGIFQGKGKAPKGSVIIMARGKNGKLDVLYQPMVKKESGVKMGQTTNLGNVSDDRISRLVYLLYLGGPYVSSEEARQNIVNGCVSITERPVGTVEGMVQ